MRLLLVARLSRAHDDSSSLDKQDAQCQRWAEAYGHEIIATAADSNVSGKTDPFERDGLGPWLKQPHLIEQYDGIVAAKLDRYARSSRYWGKLLNWASERGKTIICVDPFIDFSTPTGSLVAMVMGWLAEQELAQITQRSRDTKAWLRANNYLSGKVPFGFEIVDDRDHKGLAPHPEHAPLLREAIGMYLDGSTLRKIAKWLDGHVKPPKGGLWSSSVLSGLFRNPILIGRQVDGNGRTVLKVESIIDRATWDKLQAKQAVHAGRKGKPALSLLTGIAVCGHCDGRMYRLATGKDSAYVYYRCRGTDQDPSTCKNMTRMEALDAKVDAHVNNSPFGQFPETEIFVIAGHGHQDEIDEVEHDIRELDLDDPEFMDKLGALRAERKRLRELPMTPDIVQEIPTGRVLADVWQELDTDGRREFLAEHKMIVRVRVGEEPEITFRDTPEVIIEEVGPGRISIKMVPAE